MKEQVESGGRFWLRLTGLILVAGILVWVPFEDTSEFEVLAFSGVICLWMAARILIAAPSGSKQFLLRHMLVGAGAGLVLAPLAVFLMAFKSGIHGHSIADFTVNQMMMVLSRSPYFFLVGILLSLGIGFWRLARSKNLETEN